MPEKLKSVTRLAVSDSLRISNQNIKFSLNGFGAKLYNDLTYKAKSKPQIIQICHQEPHSDI